MAEDAAVDRGLLHTLLNHPWLLETQAEEIAAISFHNRSFARLRDAMLALQAGDKALDSEALRTQLSREESGAVVSQVERAITHKSDWFAEPGASADDVETGWRHICTLHRRAVVLEKELEAAEGAFQAEESESALARLYDIQRQLSNLEGAEAVIEGYGAASGRSG